MAKSPSKKRILHVASEAYPLIKTGGLADVVGALPLALDATGAVESTVFLPGFPAVMTGLIDVKLYAKATALDGSPVRLLSGKTRTGLRVIAADCAPLFGYAGNPYQNADGSERAGNGLAFASFSKLAAEVAMGIGRRKGFDVLHAHDWQAGLAAAYLKIARAPVTTVFTIHNLAFQGLFPRALLDKISLPSSVFQEDGLEYWDKVSCLKSGLVYSDWITTVSPTYALEIQMDESGMGFAGLLRSRSERLRGVLNGVDQTVWNPAIDADITTPFSATDWSGKAINKRALQDQLGLSKKASGPLFTIISRLTGQKGLDLVPDLLDGIVARGGQLALLGSGDTAIERAFMAAQDRHPDHISITIGYDEPFAHQLQAGADAILIPSRFEPCGLTQLCAMRYGTIPVTSRVGGLMDTVIGATPASVANGAATGVTFYPVGPHMLWAAIDRTFSLFADAPVWNRMIDTAIGQDFGWTLPAQDYLALYTS
ncbi:glycogen synthase 2 [Algimonas arctica]|uniref:Glycogen synthase n=1 Tax=Algimonas arctica TaxID=1479486 RepID=A0A8J3CPH9_9PROT|nr:glycogen synthase GlgA [Algimonas arctica]GHA86080.1 glycogen synthase 2 [Algimonas arctica]